MLFNVLYVCTDLFQNAISQSGSSFCPWGLQKNPKWAAETLGTYLDCSSDSSESLVDCLKSKTPQEIVTAQLRFNVISVIMYQYIL